MTTRSLSDDPRKSQLRAEYLCRINRVMDHIQANLDGDLSLATLAKVACFSPYHFHRIFAALVGETLSQFIARLRVERAAARLVANPAASITEIALDCGYSSPAVFSRAFREAFDQSPSEWRTGGCQDRKMGKADRKEGQPESKASKDFEVVSFHIDPRTNHPTWRVNMNASKKEIDVQVKDLPEMQVAYLRHIGPYAGQGKLFEELFGKLMRWAGPRGLIRFPQTKLLSIYYDDPAVTDESRLRLDCGMTVPADAKPDGEIGRTTLPAGKYAVARFELRQDEYPEAWRLVMGGWFPESGYQPDDRPCFELYLNDPKQHPEGKSVVEICVPVRPM
ncbi:MAG TPA: AraC family transcriptional regulator [Anaeromyxobacteraceae bacterium]|nr:AraC family transcriptional regulator [Anaeromyxobacteraceae bacterium]